METNKHKKLQKSRSSQACIREGYRFYMSHFRRIFRVTWLIAIVFAVITAATSAMPVIISPDSANTRHRHRDCGRCPAALHRWQEASQAGRDGADRTAEAAILAATPGDDPDCDNRLHLRHFCPDAVHLAAYIYHDGSQLAVEDGRAGGDPVGMPDYVLWLSIGVFLIAGFIQAYIWMTALGPGYLMKGSIAQQEKERKEFYKRTNDNNHHEEAAIVYRS